MSIFFEDQQPTAILIKRIGW